MVNDQAGGALGAIAARAVVIGLAVAGLAACQSDHATAPEVARPAAARLVSRTTGGGAAALTAHIAEVQAYAADPAKAQLITIGSSWAASMSAAQLASRLTKLQSILYPAAGDPQRAAAVIAPSTMRDQNCYSSGCAVVSNSEIMLTTSLPPDPRNVGCYASTYCSGYPSMTTAGGEDIAQMHAGSTETFYTDNTFDEYWSPSAYDEQEVSISGDAQSAALSTTSTCRESTAFTPDENYSSAYRSSV